MGSRTWIKVYCDNWIQGTLREETPDVRGIWADLLALAGSGQYGDTGEIKLTNGVGYTDEQIAQILCIKKSLWRKAKLRLVETERIKISPKGAISITNWSKYQSEYGRQKPYRAGKERSFTPEPKIPLNNPPKEIEKEIESEKLHRKVTTDGYKNTVSENTILHSYGQALQSQTALSSNRVRPIPSQGSTADRNLIKANPKKTNRERIMAYLDAHGSSAVRVISDGTGINPNPVNVTLHNGKGKVFYHDSQKRTWGLIEKGSSLGKELLEERL